MADVFLESGLEYQYESNDDYIIKLQVEDVLSIDKPIPVSKIIKDRAQ